MPDTTNVCASARRVDFSYAFVTPHRLTAALPDSSDKSLLDIHPDYLSIAWTYENLLHYPLAAFVTPRTPWTLQLRPALDGETFSAFAWTRLEGWLPALDYTGRHAHATFRLRAAGGTDALIVMIEITNTDQQPHQFTLDALIPGNWMGVNPGWVNPNEASDHLQAGWQDRADRVIVLGLGADATPVIAPTTLRQSCTVTAGETRTLWLIRPYRAVAADLPILRTQDWAAAFTGALQPWHALRTRAAQLHIPDPDVARGFYACLTDLYVMREPAADGYLGTTPGTELYRAPNPVEPSLVNIALDQLGLHEDAVNGMRINIDMQGDDGDWNDPQGWGHTFWSCAGFKAWTVMNHYRLTGDRAFLEAVYPRLLASARWGERQRATTRLSVAGDAGLTYGLLPRGMGDAGLMNDDDLYGVYLPHNIWAVYADHIALETARLLHKHADLAELDTIYSTAYADLLQALDKGAIQEDGYRWIPAVPGKTCGSRWGVLNAAFPCALLPVDHDLITGTIQKIESRISPGGIPIHTGWMKDGMWVAITLDNLGEVLLWRDEGDKAVDYLYATLNHGTPFFTYCEERGPEAGTADCSGDREHLWTPAAIVRYLRDSLVMEHGDTLHLARGAAREWLASGEVVGITGGCSAFGPVSYTLAYNVGAQRVTGSITLHPAADVTELVLHVRLPHGLRLAGLTAPGNGVLSDGGDAIVWPHASGNLTFTATVVME